jgi:Heparinase II/III-like protein/Heparinase II/III N-terminus
MDIFIPPHLTFKQVNTLISILPKSRNKDFMKTAENIIKKNAYALPPFGVIKYDNLVDWEDKRSRSYERLIHGHTFLGCLTDAYCASQNYSYVEKALYLIKDWVQKHDYKRSKDTMAYHDETSALRLQYFLRFYIVVKDKISEEDRSLLEINMWEHADLLSKDFFHSTNTNHGMFQDIALLQFSTYFKGENEELCSYYEKLATKRLKEYFENIFTHDGVHKEHSPSYHMLVVSNIRRLIGWMKEIDSNLTTDFQSIYLQAEEFAKYIIRPDGILPQICDTEPKEVKKSSYRSLFDSPEYLFSVTSGQKGKPPRENGKVFKEAGYAVFRDDWMKKKGTTYVLFTAAYNADYHKHSDDLNLYIYSNGEVITEAGPNGYNYKDPFTKYAYSSFAHNTLIVDGKGLPRTDGTYDKVYMSDYKISDEENEATGINLRYDGVSHKRKVSYKSKEQLIVSSDAITSDTEHEYKLLWHTAPDIKTKVNGNFINLFRKDKKIMEIEIKTSSNFEIKLNSGIVKPKVQGWYFPKMEDKKPLTTIEVILKGSSINVDTMFRLKSFLSSDISYVDDTERVLHPKIKNVEIQKLEDESIKVKCNAVGNELKYAFYVYKNNEVLEKFHYQRNPIFKYIPREPGSYMVRAYIRDKFNERKAVNSKVIKV